jgi:predicted transcriptional regulator
MTVPTTTIKVPKALHQRLAELARREQVTLATAIEHALDEADERSFWLAVRAENATVNDDERAEYEPNGTLGDDLDDPSDDELTAGHGW